MAAAASADKKVTGVPGDVVDDGKNEAISNIDQPSRKRVRHGTIIQKAPQNKKPNHNQKPKNKKHQALNINSADVSSKKPSIAPYLAAEENNQPKKRYRKKKSIASNDKQKSEMDQSNNEDNDEDDDDDDAKMKQPEPNETPLVIVD